MIFGIGKRGPLTSNERELLVQFANTEIALADLQRLMKGRIEFAVSPSERKLTTVFPCPEPGVKIELSHIQRAVQKRDAHLMSDHDLSLWASMLLMNEAYDWAGSEDEDEIAEELNELAIFKI